MGTGKAARGRGLSRRWTWLLVGVVALAFAVYLARPWWWGHRGPSEASPAQFAQGAEVYAANCAVCHGANAEGQAPGQPMGGQLADGTYLAPALNGTGHMWHHAPDLLRQIVWNGSPDPKSPMRGFAGRLSEEEVDAVLAYLQSSWPERLRSRYHQMH